MLTSEEREYRDRLFAELVVLRRLREEARKSMEGYSKEIENAEAELERLRLKEHGSH